MTALISQRIRETGYHKSDCLEQNYVEYFRKLGFDLIPVPNSEENIDFYLKLPSDRIILTGGGEIVEELSEKRNKTERALLDFAVKNNIPVLGICRGAQFINHYFGGELKKISEVSDQNHVYANHRIKITDKRLKMMVGGSIKTNSYHDFGIEHDELASKLNEFAISGDGLVEGLYHPQLPIAGIMWHPERESPDEKSNKKIMEAFLNKKLFWEK